MSKRRALVTGGSGDLGQAICQRLAADGFEVLVHAGSRLEKAEAVAADIRAAGGSASALCFDLTDGKHCREVLEEVVAEKPVQVLVSNAGIHADAPLAGMSRQQWQGVIDVSLNGFFNVCKPLVMPMARTRWGRVIGISSVAARGNRGQSNYAAAKAGLEAAVRTLALEMASRGITANCVAPGIIASEMTGSLFDRDSIRRLVPAGRKGTPAEVAALVAFLASDAAAYINAQTIGVDGGMR